MRGFGTGIGGTVIGLMLTSVVSGVFGLGNDCAGALGGLLVLLAPMALGLLSALLGTRSMRRSGEIVDARGQREWGTPDPGPRADPPLEERELPGPPFPARLRFGIRSSHDGRFRYTEFSCAMPGVRSRLLVVTQEWAGRAVPHPSMAPLDVGNWPYAVHTNDAAFAAGVLDATARRAVEQLDVLNVGPILLDLRPGVLILRAEGILHEQVVLGEFTARSYAVAQRLLPGRVEIGSVMHAVAANANCLVCGCGLEGAAVLCAKCNTPHHAACWEYNGGCSVFACGGRRQA